MDVVVECPACGYCWTVTADEIRRGGWMRSCPACLKAKADAAENDGDAAA